MKTLFLVLLVLSTICFAVATVMSLVSGQDVVPVLLTALVSIGGLVGVTLLLRRKPGDKSN